MKKILALCLSIFIAAPSFAAFTETLCTRNLSVYFSNGIKNTKEQAEESMTHLRNFVMPQAMPGKTFKVEGLYHQTDGFLGDLAEVFLQKANEAKYKNLPFEDKVRAWYGLPNVGAASLDTFFADWSKYQEEQLAEGAAKARLPSAAQRLAEDAQRDVANLTATLASGAKILIVSHSQGNLYANMAYESLIAGPYKAEAVERIALASFGSAAAWTYQEGSSTKNKSLYLTATNDGVINLLRLKSGIFGFEAPLEANTTSISPNDLPGHGFVDTYTNPNDPIYDLSIQLIGQQSRLVLDKPTKAIAFAQEYRADESGYDLSWFEPSPPQTVTNPKTGKVAASMTVNLEGSMLVWRTKFFCEGLSPEPMQMKAFYSPEITPHSFKALTLVNGKVVEKLLPLSGTMNAEGVVEINAGSVNLVAAQPGFVATFE